MKLFCGEDVIACVDVEGRDLQALAATFRKSTIWEEVVPGMADLTVKFDPLTLSGEEAEAQFCKLWDAPSVGLDENLRQTVLDASFDERPDLESVASALSIAADKFPAWLATRQYRVTMMGFQPGFVYLEDVEGDELPPFARLPTPRQRVAAGSIGFLGKRACVYALDGPGGWPIVGRVHEPLFRRDDPHPFLLQSGQLVRFRSR
jgi:KipI family sensor histidine kinase inhibitor